MADRTSVLQAPAQPPINALPPGLLELIVRRFEQRPLLWVVSLVCKRWRRASLASLTVLTLNTARLSNPLALTTFAQCTGLKSVTVRCAASSSLASLPQPLRCPPSLTHLTLNDASQGFDVLANLALPPLRELTIVEATPAQLKAVLCRSQATIEVLALSDERDSPSMDEVSTELAAHTLPSLTSLQVTTAWSAPLLLPFLQRHATQLLSLRFSEHVNAVEEVSFNDFAALPLTRLRTFRLHASCAPWPILSPQHAASIIGCSPHLCELELSYIDLTQLPPSLVTSLVSYTADSISEGAMSVLKSLPKLRQLSIGQRSIGVKELTHVLRTHNDALLSALSSVLIINDTAEGLERIRSLNTLTVELTVTPLVLSTEVCLTHLRELVLMVNDVVSYACLTQSLLAVTSRAPCLKILRIFNQRQLTGDAYAPLCDILCGLLFSGHEVFLKGFDAAFCAELTDCMTRRGCRTWANLRLWNT